MKRYYLALFTFLLTWTAHPIFGMAAILERARKRRAEGAVAMIPSSSIPAPKTTRTRAPVTVVPTPSMPVTSPLPNKKPLATLDGGVELIQLNTIGQTGATCGAHTVSNAWAIQNIIDRGEQVTSAKIIAEQNGNKFKFIDEKGIFGAEKQLYQGADNIPCLKKIKTKKANPSDPSKTIIAVTTKDLRSSGIEDDQVKIIARTVGLADNSFVIDDRPGGGANEEEGLHKSLWKKTYLPGGTASTGDQWALHIFKHIPGHWYLFSIIKEKGSIVPRILHVNSTNAPADNDATKRETTFMQNLWKRLIQKPAPPTTTTPTPTVTSLSTKTPPATTPGVSTGFMPPATSTTPTASVPPKMPPRPATPPRPLPSSKPPSAPVPAPSISTPAAPPASVPATTPASTSPILKSKEGQLKKLIDDLGQLLKDIQAIALARLDIEKKKPLDWL